MLTWTEKKYFVESLKGEISYEDLPFLDENLQKNLKISLISRLGRGSTGVVDKYLFEFANGEKRIYAGKIYLNKFKRKEKILIYTYFKKKNLFPIEMFILNSTESIRTKKFKFQIGKKISLGEVIFMTDLTTLNEVEIVFPLNLNFSLRANLSFLELNFYLRKKVYDKMIRDIVKLYKLGFKIKKFDSWILTKTKTEIKIYLIEIDSIEKINSNFTIEKYYKDLIYQMDEFLYDYTEYYLKDNEYFLSKIKDKLKIRE